MRARRLRQRPPVRRRVPFFRRLPLEDHGLEWIQPEIPFAHPLEGERIVVTHRSITETAERLGADGPAYRRLLCPIVQGWEPLAREVLGPIIHFPARPLRLARFGILAIRSAVALARSQFQGSRGARAPSPGRAATTVVPLDKGPAPAFALLLAGSAHARRGGRSPEGGSRAPGRRPRLAAPDARRRDPYGRVHWLTGRAPARSRGAVRRHAPPVPRAGRRPSARGLPAPPRALPLRPGRVQAGLDAGRPIPWLAEEARRAGTLHIGGTLDDVAAAEAAPWGGRVAERPFLILAQPSVFDPTRAPAGLHTAWAYCHVPNGSAEDATERIEAQVERFAPGFRDRIVARHRLTPADFERRNPNLVGGDLAAGAMTLPQLVFRPVPALHPYDTPLPGVFLCSASTPPGGGVHGMCGHRAACRALGTVLGGGA